MTARMATVGMAVGLVLLSLSLFQLANDDLLHIGGVGFIVSGAMAFSISSEMPDAGPPTVIRSDRTSRRPTRGRHAKPLFRKK